MFHTGIISESNKVLPFASGYVSFSSKYKKHYLENFEQKEAPTIITFLSGAAGTGKTCTLEAEFLNPLQNKGVPIYRFNFVPDQILHNHFFLNSITKNILSDIRCNFDTRVLELKAEWLKFQASYTKHSKDLPFDYNEINRRFAQILADLSEVYSYVLVFEDVHLARKNFYDFLNQIPSDSSNMQILCTTRQTKQQLHFSSAIKQKWFVLECLSEKSLKKYLAFLSKDFPTGYKSPDKFLDLSGGNPFYIKELCLLNRAEKNSRKNSTSQTTFSPHEEDGRKAITSIRLHCLPAKSRKLLSILATLGYSANYDEALALFSHYKIGQIEETLKVLQADGLIRVSEAKIFFQHHLYYEGIRNEIGAIERKEIHKSVFTFLFKRRSSIGHERLIQHAQEADLKNYACVLAKKFADQLYKDAHYELASYYYDVYLETLKICSSPSKSGKRTIEALIPLHAISLILGDPKKEESISSFLQNIMTESDLNTRYNIDAALTTSYWTTGNFKKAQQFASQNVINAKKINDRHLIIASKARYGALCMEVGDFQQSLTVNDKILELIDYNERHDKFGLFISGYAAALTVQSICHYEVGDFNKSRELAIKSYKLFEQSNDDFTRLYVSVHAGYSMAMMGEHKLALSYLDKGLSLSAKNKMLLIASPGLALSGLCHAYLGNIDAAQSNMSKALSLTERTFKGSKRGIIDLAWMESLLVGFKTLEFSQNIDRVIEENKKMQQISHVGWLYFLKAIYHGFYQDSIQGFVGAFVKAGVIAQTYDMRTLQANLQKLAQLEPSGILSNAPKDISPSTFFDKAEFFYNLTKKVKPISFHIENRTRS